MTTLIKNIAHYVDQEITIKGWVYNMRRSGKIAFPQVRDGSGFIQCIVHKPSVNEQVWETQSQLTLESSIAMTGTVSKHPKKEEYELQVSNIQIFHIADDYPIGKKEHGPEFLLDHRHLWLRSKRQWAIQRIRHTLIQATYDWFRNQSFTKIDSPILTPNACEGTTTLFDIDYFDMGKAYLSQSGQLYLEAAIMSLGRVFDFGPVFRAEKSKTRRHLIEFWMMDAEIAFCDHDENIQIQEQLISYMIAQVLAHNQDDLMILERDISKLEAIKAPFTRMTHAEAIKQLREMGSTIEDNADLGAEDETLLTQNSDLPIFIDRYPSEIKAFYMKRAPENDNLVLGSDLLAPEGYGEICGGSQREDDYDTLLNRIREHNLSEDHFSWYLDLRKYGSCVHSGFGFGLERIVCWVCGIKHVRETIPFPRLLNRMSP